MGNTGKGKARSILVIDDDIDIATMIKTKFSKQGFVVTTAHDGLAGIAAVKRDQPDIVLLDVMMPNKSGWEVAKAIKADPATQATKIIILSAIGPTVTDATSVLYGADAHLDKPFDFAKLEALIEEVLAR
jgi:two-component system, OmpR family, alkaline phosphatase synthesis response regulator PhoP